MALSGQEDGDRQEQNNLEFFSDYPEMNLHPM